MTQGNQGQKIGIIGDGQLALMLAEALLHQKVDFVCLSDSVNSPMELRFPKQTTKDAELFQASATKFTLENEFLSVESIERLLKNKASKLFPNLESYSHFSNKISQRRLYERLGIPSPKWVTLPHPTDFSDVLEKFPFPFILKASAGGYDGKGVRVIHDEKGFMEAVTTFGWQNVLIEEKIPLKLELAQGFLRNDRGDSTILPLVETFQRNGICEAVYYPAQVSEAVRERITAAIKKLMAFELVGIFNFEFFVDAQDEIFINEGAPRPHNSQHLGIDASTLSQFDLLAMYLSQSPKIPSSVETKPSAMVNLLGKSSGPNYTLKLPALPSEIGVRPKLYDKAVCSPGRKMGHVNLLNLSTTADLRHWSDILFKEYDL